MSWTTAPQGLLPPAALSMLVVAAGIEAPPAGPLTLGVACYEHVDLTTVTGAALSVQKPDMSTMSWPATYLAADSLAIGGATNASPIVCTVPSTAELVGLATSLTIGGVLGNVAANGKFFVEVLDGTTFALYSDAELLMPVAGDGVYLSGGTATPNATGTVTRAVAAASSDAPLGDLDLVGDYSITVLLTVPDGVIPTTAGKLRVLSPFA